MRNGTCRRINRSTGRRSHHRHDVDRQRQEARNILRATAVNPVAPPREGLCRINTARVCHVDGGAERRTHSSSPGAYRPYPFRYRATASGANTATIATVHSNDRPT